MAWKRRKFNNPPEPFACPQVCAWFPPGFGEPYFLTFVREIVSPLRLGTLRRLALPVHAWRLRFPRTLLGSLPSTLSFGLASACAVRRAREWSRLCSAEAVGSPRKIFFVCLCFFGLPYEPFLCRYLQNRPISFVIITFSVR